MGKSTTLRMIVGLEEVSEEKLFIDGKEMCKVLSCDRDIARQTKRNGRLWGLEEVLERKSKELSGGQKQRTVRGRAIIRNPKIFLMEANNNRIYHLLYHDNVFVT